nr:unnamed protein product [Spirometra erinaceieuropaei]
MPSENADPSTDGEPVDHVPSETDIPTEPPEVLTDPADYAKHLEEFKPTAWSSLPDNPFYETADVFFDLQGEIVPGRGQHTRRVEVTCRGRYAYQLDEFDAYLRIADISQPGQCVNHLEKCPEGISVGAWISLPANLTAQERPLSLFEIAGELKVAVYGEFLHVFGEEHNLLRNSDHFWTTDAYMLHDAECILQFLRAATDLDDDAPATATGVPGFSLSSLYKPLGIDPLRYMFDQNDKGPVPVFSMQKKEYFMLGRRKKRVPEPDDISWADHCLHNPSEETCGSSGVTLSLWISIQSVGPSRLRYFLNSGDVGDCSSTASADYTGWAVFTHGTLLGVSVGETDSDWELMLDSTSYNLDTWVNLGVIWCPTVGLTLLLNGEDYNMQTTVPEVSKKTGQAPPYVVLSRYNTDDSSTWLTPSEAEERSNDPINYPLPVTWELADFAFSHAAFVSQAMEPFEYAQHFGFLGNRLISQNSKYLWFGNQLTDPKVGDLLKARRMKLQRNPGPVSVDGNSESFFVTYNEQIRSVVLKKETMITVGPLDPETCPQNMSACAKGFTVGGWYSLVALNPTGEHKNHSEPVILLSGLGGNFGLALIEGGWKICGWVVLSSASKNPITTGCFGSAGKLTLSVTYDQWFHVALAVFPLDREFTVLDVQILLNGKVIAVCNYGSSTADVDAAINRSRQLFETTHSDPVYLIASSSGLRSAGLAVSVIQATTNAFIHDARIHAFLGLPHSQSGFFADATFYWATSGWLTHLAPHRLVTNEVTRSKGRYNEESMALCTSGDAQSYIVLTGDTRSGSLTSNLAASCLFGSLRCQEFSVMIDFTLKETLSPDAEDKYVISAPPGNENANIIGFQLILQPRKNQLAVVVRSSLLTCRNHGNMSLLGAANTWNYIQVFVYSTRPPDIKVNGEILNTGGTGVCVIERNSMAPANGLIYPRIVVGQNISLCVTDIAVAEGEPDSDGGQTPDISLSQTCYDDTDFVFGLEGSEPNFLSVPGTASLLASFNSSLPERPGTGCLTSPDTSCDIFTISFWLMISAEAVNNREPHFSEDELLVLSTGPPKFKGLAVYVQYEARSKGVHLIVEYREEKTLSRVFAIDLFQVGEWTNIGIVYVAPTENSEATLEVYKDGEALVSTSMPMPMSLLHLSSNPIPGIYLGNSVRKIANMSEANVASGTISSLAIWSKRGASCGTPRQTRKSLLGECALNESIPTTEVCQNIQHCTTMYGGVCLDENLANIYSMAKSRWLIYNPLGLLELLRVAKRLLALAEGHPVKSDEARLLWASSALLSRLANVDFSDPTEMRFLVSEFASNSEFLLEMVQCMESPTFSETWVGMRNLTAMEVPNILSVVSGFLESIFVYSTIGKQDVSVLAKVEQNTLGFFKRPGDFGSWADGGYLMPNFKIHFIEKGLQEQHRSQISNRSSDQKEAFIISFARFQAVSPNITLDLLALPRTANWTTDEVQSGHGNAKVKGLLPIYSGIQRVSTLPTYISGNVVHYETAIPLIVENEYKAVAFARITDAMHWKAKEIASVGSSEMEFGVQCVYWNESSTSPDNRWDPSICTKVTGSLTSVTCRCKHAGIFAVAMESPEFGGHPESYWKVVGAPSLRVFNLVKVCLNAGGNSLSFFALISLFVYLYKKQTESELAGQNKIKINFTLALAIYHLTFMLIPFLEQFKTGCLLTSILLHLFGSAYLAWHACQCFYLFGALINGSLANRINLYIFIGWIISSITVLIVCATSAADYGLGRLCLPAAESSAMYVFISQTAFWLFLSLVCCFILLCNVDTPAYLKPLIIEALQHGMWLVIALTAYITVNFHFFLAYLYSNTAYVAFIYWALNAFQGVMVALCFGLLDVNHVGRKRRKKVHDSPVQENCIDGNEELNGKAPFDETYPTPYEECEPAMVDYEDWDSIMKEKGA